jgi:hypothetical protein
MSSISHKTGPETLQPTAAPNADASPNVLACLMDALASPERYTIIGRDGELFITPSHPLILRFAKRKRSRVMLLPQPCALCAA